MILELRNQNKPTKKNSGMKYSRSIAGQLANNNLDENYNEKYREKTHI